MRDPRNKADGPRGRWVIAGPIVFAVHFLLVRPEGVGDAGRATLALAGCGDRVRLEGVE